ncbi:hypothetical protein KA005_66515, partial [bacterium]|nr:hypothetical protein [bacterium]
MRNSTIVKLMLTSFFSLLFISAAQSQVTQAAFYAVDDVSLMSGTGATLGDPKDLNFGGGPNLAICNFDDFPGYNSPSEVWIKFDLTTLEDSIPDGQAILYAEIATRVSNNTGQGYICHNLKDIDDWKEGDGGYSTADQTGEGLTWTAAQAFDYENPDNFTHINTLPVAPGTGSFINFEVTPAVEYEMGESGNKILTLRFTPSIAEYDPPTIDKTWLGFYAREAQWGTVMENGINLYAPNITFYIGAPQPTEFSDIENFGDIGNYDITPAGFQKWIVADDEADARLIINGRPAPINGTPGGVAVYNMDTYGDFDISVKAKLNKIKSGALDPKADFIIAFGYEDGENYSYMRFTGEDINGFYLVDTAGAVEVGDLSTTPAVSDTAYHDYRLVRTGTTVTAYIDGTEYLSVTDDALGTEGGIGMGSYNDVALFDDFVEGEEPGAVNDLYLTRFSIYPNPAGDILNIKAENNMQKLVIT